MCPRNDNEDYCGKVFASSWGKLNAIFRFRRIECGSE
jgi:hypothetical protein